MQRIEKGTDSLPELSPFTTWERNLMSQEEKAWERVLGVRVTALQPPPYVTSLREKQLERFGLKLHFFPALALVLDNLRASSVEDYLRQLACHYPNWQPFEALTEKEINNPLIAKNLKADFWEKVKGGEIQLPVFPGYWLAVEALPKPNYYHRYKDTRLTQRLEVFNRFNYDPLRVEKRVKEKRSSLLAALDLPQEIEVRLPEAIEWNLLGNRNAWGGSTAYEWTNTVMTTTPGKVKRVIIGGKDLGGAASFYALPPDEPYDMAGFRLVFVLKSEKFYLDFS